MFLVIKSNLNTTGLTAVMKIVESNYSSKPKWISRNKKSNNCGDSTFPYKIKTTFKSKAKQLKFSKKFIQSSIIEEH